MCGIVGIVRASRESRDNFDKMLSAIEHRGPDSNGQWFCEKNGVALGHRRLAILDVSEAGAQPMRSASGRYVVTYNGEIYNHQQLRAEIQQLNPNKRWFGGSDTETLLAGVELWGVETCLQRIKGMFAFGLWDSQESSIIIARDRLGEKPLYYGVQRNQAFFSSELKALLPNTTLDLPIDEQAMGRYLSFGFVPTDYCIYKGVNKLPPGYYAKLSMEDNQWNIYQYYNVRDIAEEGALRPFSGTESDCIAQVDETLTSVVNDEMISDVSLGAFLSGGVDSSLIVALMQKLSSKPVKTFTVGFQEKSYDESIFAEAVAKSLGTDHTSIILKPEELLDIVPAMGGIYDEPFSDQSAIPTYLVSVLARESVKVALSGDGGDELFCGYNRHSYAAGKWGQQQKIPTALRSAFSNLLSKLPDTSLEQMLNVARRIPGVRMPTGDLTAKVRKWQRTFPTDNIETLYNVLLSISSEDVGNLVEFEVDSEATSPVENAATDLASLMMLKDQLFYLPDDILTKVDRASMATSLETRAPFLHPDMVSLAWSIPLHYKHSSNVSKKVLRELLYNYVPREMVDRPKSGFEIPLRSWMKVELKEWVNDILNDGSALECGFISRKGVSKLLREHYELGIDRTELLWRIAMFQSWHESR